MGGIFFIYFGYKDKKKNGKADITLTEYRLIYFGIIAIILALLGLFSIVPWEKVVQ